ncbi:DUF4249 domain-containing protein [Fibrella arboris]|uniref:DUF4249 domain-containing protein n=1 Tax=Fibrella arboris TaxID=3242486 RepID=UPI003522AD84
MTSRFLGYLLLLGVSLSQACVDAFDPELSLSANVLVVNGLITDLPGPQQLMLSRSRSRSDSASSTTPVTRATVTVLVNGKPLPLTEASTEPGTYQFPAGFRGQTGTTYQLQFRTAEGVSYESSAEVMTASPPITRVYDTFNPTGLKTTADALPTPTNDVFLDFTDPADQRNFYLWRWRLYELQSWCATCVQGRYVVKDIGDVGSGPVDVIGCVADKALPYQNKFDYACLGFCWDIFYSSTIDVMADLYTNGTAQVGHKVASVPIYQRDPALITIEQLAISANAYRYYRLIADQSQNTGTLADSPPAPLAGNVHNLAAPNENVVGYFTAASVSTYNYKMNRKNVTSGSFKGLFFAQNGRQPNVDVSPGGVYGAGLPSAMCVPNRYRTADLPPGWNQ